MTDHTAWAVVQHCEPYHPEGDKSRTSTEFVYWIFTTREEAARRKARLLLSHHLDRRIEVRKVNEESWSIRFGAKTKPAPKEEEKA